ncbi:DivIVA domain-containing protein [Actinoplanes sp. CA-142083]|uniref:DivIVA domain-containing protein n=1 Tax=Actinoplanes sp. CA-142083 TaxID=3239903 RepID=UPI003D9133FF
MAGDFITVLRGYDKAEVEQVIGRAVAALSSGGDLQREAARDELRSAQFAVALRGYDRAQVDSAVEELARQLDAGAQGADGDLRSVLAQALRLEQPSDQAIVDEVRRLRELADLHNL